jgi:transcriptional regulator with XRE-family HTH domain
MNRSNFRRARKTIDVSVGESVRIIRELQNALAERTGIPQSTISAIENDRVKLGVERAKVIARALRVHPAMLLFPGWDVETESAA